MKKLNFKSFVISIICACALTSPAHADLVNTGPGPQSGGGSSIINFRPDDYSSVAALIEIDHSDTIKSVEGWFQWYPWRPNAGLTISLYTNQGGVPGTILFAETRGGLLETGNQSDWRGFADLKWNITPGEYWVSFSTPPPDSYYGGGFGLFNAGVENPLKSYLHYSYNDFGGAWRQRDWVNDYAMESHDDRTPGQSIVGYGIRINAIPEPSTYALMGLGLLAVGVCRRPKKSS
jgi:hypothetical protein